MRLNNITIVFCLFCVLIVFCVNSEKGCRHGWYGSNCKFRCVCVNRTCDNDGKCSYSKKCPNGWFGFMCKYKCRCVNNSCDIDGKCMGSYTCLGGWFGPECQYDDMAYKTSNMSVLTDGDDTTCAADKADDTVTIFLNESIVFTWLRVYANGNADLGNLSLTFSLNKTAVNCPNLKKYSANKTTVDMHCNLTDYINAVTLKGAAVASLCSVYISGGRNVALKERADQEVTYYSIGWGNVWYNHTGDLAVDGDITQNFFVDIICASTYNTSSWTLTLSRPRSVHRYFIYNRAESFSERLKGFILESFDSMNHSLFVYQDKLPTTLIYYTVTHMPLPVTMVVITTVHKEAIKMITLCEVELYGDSICDNQHYGRDCELECNCLDNEACSVSTGDCLNGCPDGFQGHACMDPCLVEKFGKDCNQSCSEACEPPDNDTMRSCDASTGACLKGCTSGFSGDLCQTECDVGMFGKNCSSECSQNCEQSDDEKMRSCNYITGDCNKGCKRGFTGPNCTSECAVGMFGKNCSSECSQNCEPSDDEKTPSCNYITGACSKGCKSGFTGTTCTSECSDGSFGKNCSSSCSKHCAVAGNSNKPSCDPVTGACGKGCTGGYSGDLCLSTADVSTDSGIGIELIIGLLAFVAAVIFAGICLRKKRQTTPSAERTADDLGSVRE